MIEKLTLRNFKCFQAEKTFNFSKLNLLTGINGRGKSSVLQSVLVLAQSAWQTPDINKLIINGELISLGNFDDIKNSETKKGESIYLKFKLSNFDDELVLEYIEDPKEPLLAIKKGSLLKNETIIKFSDVISKIHFIGADRLGPVKYKEKINLPKFLHVGQRGEYAINILANSMNLDNVNDLLYRGKDAKSLIQQTMEWLSYILEGAKIDIGGKDAESSILYMLINNKQNSYAYKPVNVGFGYSYILPLIITGLIAKPGEIIMIENPEAHLHPRAQSRISEFFAIVASTGIQVFIESHSEHILNSFRVCVLKSDIPLQNNEFVIHYFNENFESEELSIDEKGKIENWPSGFFDQEEIDLANIFKYGKKLQ
jgi:predicted ATPase